MFTVTATFQLGLVTEPESESPKPGDLNTYDDQKAMVYPSKTMTALEGTRHVKRTQYRGINM